MTNDIEHIGQLKPDKRNARRHTPRNVGMIERSLNEVGAARSIVIDEDGNILAGNATVEAAAQAGIERVQVVDADGETIVAVRRRGLTPEQKTKLSLYDNRSAELADWCPDILAEISQEIDLSALWNREELAETLVAVPERPDFGSLIEQFQHQKGKAEEDENWFYIEYYGDAQRFHELSELLTKHFVGESKHQLDHDFFYDLIKAASKPGL